MMKRWLLIALICLTLPLCGAALLAESAPPPDTQMRALQYGDRGDDVLLLQTRLQELCYYTGPLSGQFAEMTRAAVRSVQADYGLTQTGVADAATQDIIYGVCFRTLRYNMTGDDVTRMQQWLASYGYYSDKVSGRFLNNTQNAITAFQRDNGLAVTGVADAEMLALLYSGAAHQPTPSPTPSPTPTPAPTPTPNLNYPGRLAYGSEGARVKQLQERLKELGYFEGKATNGFYAKTQAAVKAFQLQNGLTSDGVVGQDTWSALYAPDVVPPSGTPKPTPEPTPVPYFIEVDVTNQVTKVFTPDENGEYTVLHKAFICSTGTKGYPSDVGLWTITQRRALWAQFPRWGGGTAQYWTRINDNIAFHSVIYEEYDPTRLVESSYRALGSRASHGCIRLTVPDAKWIYQNCKSGVQVWIHEDAPSDPELTHSLKPGSINPKTLMNYVTPTPTAAPVYNSGNPPETTRQMTIGTKGEDVYWVQMRLKELGYYTGTVTGAYRAGTQSAVKKYQRAVGLAVDGVAGRNTLSRLYGDARAQAVITPTPTPTSPAAFTPTPTYTPTSTPDLSHDYVVDDNGVG